MKRGTRVQCVWEKQGRLISCELNLPCHCEVISAWVQFIEFNLMSFNEDVKGRSGSNANWKYLTNNINYEYKESRFNEILVGQYFTFHYCHSRTQLTASRHPQVLSVIRWNNKYIFYTYFLHLFFLSMPLSRVNYVVLIIHVIYITVTDINVYVTSRHVT